jgi:16S rRNA (uracil1498-N3)-methyltransferase
MMAPRFFSPLPLAPELAGQAIELPESAAHHAVRVLRLAVGDALTLFDGAGGEYAATLVRIDRRGASVRIERFVAIERESHLAVTLAQGIAANDAMDYAIRKATELGVTSIQPLVTARSAPFPPGERGDKRLAHWRQVAIAACEQCGRNQIPKVMSLVALSDYRAESTGLKLLLSPLSEAPLSKIATKGEAFVIAAGPEAGFNAAEEAALVEAGFVPVRLGPRVLRTETAALAALAALNALRGDF